MARTLSKIKEQIAKLQKEADSIQSSVIARIKKEIALHDLTAEHLFGGTTAISSVKAKRTRAVSPNAATAKKKPKGKPAKFADDQGNTWGGIGKRPQWIREALDAGRTLEEFLVSAAKPVAKPKTKAARPSKSAATPARKKVAARTKPAKAAAPGSKTKVPAKKSRKPAASVKKAPAKKVAAKKTRAAKNPASAPETAEQAAS